MTRPKGEELAAVVAAEIATREAGAKAGEASGGVGASNPGVGLKRVSGLPPGLVAGRIEYKIGNSVREGEPGPVGILPDSAGLGVAAEIALIPDPA